MQHYAFVKDLYCKVKDNAEILLGVFRHFPAPNLCKTHDNRAERAICIR